MREKPHDLTYRLAKAVFPPSYLASILALILFITRRQPPFATRRATNTFPVPKCPVGARRRDRNQWQGSKTVAGPPSTVARRRRPAN
jgi:hypothetical protein